MITDGTGCYGRCAPRASAGRITAVIPYFGYARQDRRVRSARVPIALSCCRFSVKCGIVDRVLTVDLHAEQIRASLMFLWICVW